MTARETKQPGAVLVIDDEPVVVDVLRTVLGKQGYRIDAGTDAAGCRDLLESGGEWDVLLLDVMLPDANGLEVLRWIHERRPELAVVMITAEPPSLSWQQSYSFSGSTMRLQLSYSSRSKVSP